MADLIIIDIISDEIIWIKQNLKSDTEQKLILKTRKIEKAKLVKELKNIDKESY